MPAKQVPTHKGRFASWPHVDDAGDACNVLMPLDRLENLQRPDELRMDDEEFKRTCTSIGERGLFNAVEVRRMSDGLYRIVHGRHRAAAHVELGFDTVPAEIEELDDENEAIRTLEENMLRKDLAPHQEATAFQEAMDAAGLTQKQLAAKLGISQAKVSKRLAMRKAPACIAELAPRHLRIEDVPEFEPLVGHDELAKAVAEVLIQDRRPAQLYGILREACKGKNPPACLPFDSGYGTMVDKHAGVDWNMAHRIVDNKKYREEILELDHITFDADHEDLVVCLDIRGAKDAIERTKQRLQEYDEKQAKDKPKQTATGFEKSPAEKRQDRIRNKERRLQLDHLVQHLAKQDTFAEDLVNLAYKEFLKSVGQVASRKVEQEALASILGEHAPRPRKTAWGSTEVPLSRGCPELVDQLWDDHRAALDRYVAAVSFLHAGGYDHFVRDDQVLKLTTGKTTKQIHAAAVSAVDGPKKPKKKPAKGGALKVPCLGTGANKCGAAAGEVCKGAGGKPLARPHQARVAAAKEATT